MSCIARLWRATGCETSWRARLGFAAAIVLAADVYISTHVERNSRLIVKRLQRGGWELVSVRGSHHKFRRGAETLVVPHPKKDLPLGTARSIARSAGWSGD